MQLLDTCIEPEHATTKRSPIVTKLREIISLDKRSLALFRVMIALTSLWDLYDRARDLRAHYTDAGFFSREMALSKFWNFYWFSFHMMSGAPGYMILLFIVHAIIAFMLLIGYRTRTMTFLTWVFTLSLQCRNILVGHGGDVLHRVVLFFGIFLPLGEYFSVDSAFSKKQNSKNHSRDTLVANVCSLAFMCQILLMYVCAFNHKTGDAWRTEGTAAWLALQLDFFRRPIGDVLLWFPTFLKLSTFGVLYWQGFGPLFFFSPVFTGPMRSFGVLGFFTMHAFFAGAFRLGQFGWVTLSSILALLPAFFWDDIVFRFLKTKSRTHFKLYYIKGCQFCEFVAKILKTFFLFPEVEVLGVQHLKLEEDPCQCGNHCNWTEEEMVHLHVPGRRDGYSDREAGWFNTVDSHGKLKGGMDAFISLCEASPLLFPFAPVLKNEAIKTFGKRCMDISHAHEPFSERTEIENPKIMYKRKKRYQEVKLFFKIMGKICLNLFAGFCLYLAITWNAEVLHMPRMATPAEFRPLVYTLHLDQAWSMFSPRPPDSWWWYNIEAQLENGTQVELFNKAAFMTLEPNPFSWDKPAPFYQAFKNHRWFKYWENGYNQNEVIRLDFGRWMCREWNSYHSGPNRLYRFSIHFMSERNSPKFDGSRIFQGHQTLWNHQCYEK